MSVTTKIYGNYQTAIPSEIRKKLNITKDHVIEWSIDENGKPKIEFRKKMKLRDIRGSIKLDHETNSVELVKELYK
ncbi:MAG: type II toxin-antitoxin system PrlF family antitoxin [Methanobacteriaceae archaeon]|jgi:bifunctional DNA-binding transcriptional regulator/antitoxin component of YhaV-PrlF toxin-antitoxin module|nr:type II toxin-antitoxin system PrlF family antitoxin [Methanobacteriaceae archaeon]